ncbi:hypothetical protein AAKU52_001809 [Pedobacter sp. CG_S7]|uniref:DUF4411 family protein n=1 Tax=Pedobacter sp. CG_S7 TaxID=3143930 RepID=UPI0033930EDE
MAAPFVLDSNFFIQAHRMHYPMDVVPSFWLKIKELAKNGIIVSIDKVKDEIHLNVILLNITISLNKTRCNLDFFGTKQQPDFS